MKEECTVCSMNWQTKDFSISSLMRPTVHHPGHLDPRHDAVLLSAYLYKLGYYQPAGPLIKESGEADRALARYHPPPHYHPPHPPVLPHNLPQYPPYYSPELCYQYYRRPGPYHMPPQPDPPMVGVGGEPYPPPQYYGTPPCYQHSPQRIPYVEYRSCPCPLNTCPKNVHIGPATGKAPTGGGPDPSLGGPSAGAFRPKVRATRDHVGVADLIGSGKDPPLESEPPAAADAPHPCPVPAIGGASPKRELYDVRDNLRLAGDLPGSALALGPPSPARGSAGVCTPQPPTVPPRRARLGKAMARRSLAGDDTGFLMSAPQPPPAHHSDIDDDVMAISPPLSAPIDLSSSDERSTPLVDVKKENEGPIYATPRKIDAQALREHNTTAVSENTDAAKPVKRRYSRPKLEIEMNNTQLEDSLKTNGIGEHVKLQKRRKVSGDQTNVTRVEPVTKEPKRKTPQNKRTPKTPNEKKALKRKSDGSVTTPKAKRMLMKPSPEEEARNKSIAMTTEDLATKPKIKSALLLDNLIRKNSVDAKGYTSDKELNPAELFLTPMESPNKKTNINNNIVENSPPTSGVRPNTIAAVTQLIEKKLAYKKACKLEKVDSKIMHTSKSVLNAPVKPSKCKLKCDKESEKESMELNDKSLSSNSGAVEDAIKSFKVSRVEPKVAPKTVETNAKLAEESHTLSKIVEESSTSDKPKSKDQSRGTPTKVNGQMKNKSIETVAKLLGSKKPLIKENDLESSGNQSNIVESIASKINENSVKKNRLAMESEIEKKAKNIEKVAKLLAKPSTTVAIEEKLPSPIEELNFRRKSVEVDKDSRKHSNGELKPKHAEKVAKLMVSKRPTIKTDEALEVVEDACASPLPAPVGRRARRRRSGASVRRMRKPPALVAPPSAGPKAPPRWSNGWEWDGDSYVSQVYINNDSRLDRPARCWQRMTHASGDTIGRGDCVLLRASTAKAQPFVARVASLWENADDGEMMVSLVWYYRPEHTERGRVPSDAPDEVFASRHRDANSVACIEDKCYVLTFNEYCRYRKRLKAADERVNIAPSIVPPLPASEYTPLVAPKDSQLPPNVAPDLVMFCRKIYDFRLKKLLPPSNK